MIDFPIFSMSQLSNKGATETKFGTRVAYGMRMMPKRQLGITLDDAKQNWPHITAAGIDRTCVVVTALSNQSEAFAC